MAISSPLSRLPNETFVRIASLARDAYSHEKSKRGACGGMKWLVELTGVCVAWREMIIGTPLLWSTLDLSWKNPFLVLCLTRSQTANLSIFILAAPGDLLRKVHLLAPHSSRVSNIEVLPDYGKVPAALAALMAFPLPRLLSLSLTGAPADIVQSMIRHSPSVRSVALSKLTFDWMGFPGLSQLTTLKLAFVTLRGHHTLSTLLDILEACKSLQCFSWKDAPQLCDHDSVDGRNVSLPHIQAFHFSSGQIDVAKVTAHISLPSTARLSLGISAQLEDGEDMCDFELVLPAREDVRLPILEDIRYLLVSYDESAESLVICADSKWSSFWEARPWRSRAFRWPADPADTPDVAIYLAYDFTEYTHDEFQFHHILCRLGDSFPPTVQTLVVCGSPDQNQWLIDETDAWGHLFRAFPQTTRMDVIATESTDIWSVPLALRSPFGHPLPCTGLQELYLRFNPNDMFGYAGMGTNTFEEVVITLEERAQQGCTRLKSLTFAVEPVDPDEWVLEAGSSAKMPEHMDDIEEGLTSLVDELIVELPNGTEALLSSAASRSAFRDSEEELEDEESEDEGEGDDDDDDEDVEGDVDED